LLTQATGGMIETMARTVNTFVALDFETADYGQDSACALGLVRVEAGRIVQREHCLIRPPRRRFVFTHIHGLTWQDVAAEPSFAELWPEMEDLLEGIDFLAAHNARFDAGVLRACCRIHGLPVPRHRFICTVRLARKAWQVKPTTLPHVCQYLGIRLRHHHAVSDAEACARIVLAAMKDGVEL
jgi:DNA polymerase III subunit epsilon